MLYSVYTCYCINLYIMWSMLYSVYTCCCVNPFKLLKLLLFRNVKLNSKLKNSKVSWAEKIERRGYFVYVAKFPFYCTIFKSFCVIKKIDLKVSPFFLPFISLVSFFSWREREKEKEYFLIFLQWISSFSWGY